MEVSQNKVVHRICERLLHNKNDVNLTPQLNNIARFLVACCLLIGFKPFDLRVSYFEVFYFFGESFDDIIKYAFYLGALLIICTRYIRQGSALCGLTLWFGLLACRSCHSNAHLYLASVFIIISFSSREIKNKLLELQIIILYLGSVTIKMIDIDWWNGNYFEALMITRHSFDWYIFIDGLLPEKVLSVFFGVFTILIELLIPLFFMQKKWWRYGLFCSISFHSIMVLIMGSTFGPFYYALLASYLVFVEFDNISRTERIPLSNCLSGLFQNFKPKVELFVLINVELKSGMVLNLYCSICHILIRYLPFWYLISLLCFVFPPVNVIVVCHILFLFYYRTMMLQKY